MEEKNEVQQEQPLQESNDELNQSKKKKEKISFQITFYECF